MEPLRRQFWLPLGRLHIPLVNVGRVYRLGPIETIASVLHVATLCLRRCVGQSPWKQRRSQTCRLQPGVLHLRAPARLPRAVPAVRPQPSSDDAGGQHRRVVAQSTPCCSPPTPTAGTGSATARRPRASPQVHWRQVPRPTRNLRRRRRRRRRRPQGRHRALQIVWGTRPLRRLVGGHTTRSAPLRGSRRRGPAPAGCRPLAEPRPPTGQDRAAAWLLEQLRSGPVISTELHAGAAAAAIGRGTLARARGHLEVTLVRLRGERGGARYWTL